MKVELCVFSGYKIYPGHGTRYVKADGKSFYLLNKKCKRMFLAKKNPRRVHWTLLYRRKNKKGQMEETVKRKSRKTHKYNRPIAGNTLSDILAKKNMKPEVRQAQREQAIRAYKEKQKAAAAKKPSSGSKPVAAKPKPPKQMKAAKPAGGKAPGRVGGKR